MPRKRKPTPLQQLLDTLWTGPAKAGWSVTIGRDEFAAEPHGYAATAPRGSATVTGRGTTPEEAIEVLAKKMEKKNL